MKLMQFIKRLGNEYSHHGWKIAYYYLRGHVRWWIHNRAIKQWYEKSVECPDCFEKGSCVHCGCPFNELSLSGKRCVGRIINEAKTSPGINKFIWKLKGTSVEVDMPKGDYLTNEELDKIRKFIKHDPTV